MNAHIFKYEIPVSDDVVCLELPENIHVCDINHQNEKIYLWGLVDIHAKLSKRYFKIVGTGHQIQDMEYLDFIKTVHIPMGFVFHIFEVKY